MYDLISNSIVLDFSVFNSGNQNSRLKDVQILDQNRLVVITVGDTIKILKAYETEPIFLKGIRDVRESCVFDPYHVLITRFSHREIILWNSVIERRVHRWNLGNLVGDITDAGFQKISATECIFYAYDDNLVPHFYLIDVFKKTIKDLGTVDFKALTPVGLREIFVLNQNYFFSYNGDLWSIPNKSKVFERFINSPVTSIIALDHNHVAYVARNGFQVIVKFVPQASTMEEIFAEIKKQIALRPAQPAQPQKRAASSTQEERPIPAAAQGARPEVPEIKRKRPEKPNE